MHRHSPRDEIPQPASAIRAALPVALLVAIGCASVALEGFRFGVGNHGLQVPILQRAVNPELFPGDPFMATLDRYTSAVWWGLAQVGRLAGIQDWEPIVFVMHVVSRVLFLAGFHALIGVYVRDRRVLLPSVAVLGLGSALHGPSVVGVHGLLGRVPDHTGFANAFALFALASALRGRHISAAVFAALVFDINPFVGVWLAPVLAATLYASPEGRTGPRRRWLAAAAVYVVLVSPVALWVLSTVAAPDPPGVQPFDYRAFLYEYFPKHFFIDSASWRALIELATIVLVGVAGVVVAGPAARGLRACYAAWITLFLLGAAAPYLTSSPSILNLHPLRMDAFLIMLAAVAAVVCAARILDERDRAPEALAAGIGILAGLATGYWWLTLAAIVVAGMLLAEPTGLRRWLVLSLLAVSAASASVLVEGTPGNKGFLIASLVALLAIVAATRAFSAAAFVVVAASSWTQQPSAVVLSLGAILMDSAPWSQPARRRVLAQAVLVGAALLAFARTNTTNNRLLLGVMIAALLLEPLFSRARLRFAPLMRRAGPLAYAGLVGLIAVGAAIELRRPGPKDPLAAEVAAWRNLQEWAKAHTRVDDVFAVPDWPDAFGVWAERSIWVDWKHGAAVMWAPPYYWTYRERRRVQAEATDASAFSQATGVCFAVVDVTDPGATFPAVNVLASGLPVLFRNERFAVVGLCGGSERGRPA